jgi:glycine cleavage system aminomethyltransferase T
MSSLSALHLKNKAVMGMFNGYSVPAVYNDIFEEYKALRENVLLVDYSHMSIVSVMGEDAWSLVNHLISADISIIRDEQGMYSLVLNEDGTIRGDIYAFALLKVTIFYLKIFPLNAYRICLKIFLQKQMNLISRKFL